MNLFIYFKLSYRLFKPKIIKNGLKSVMFNKIKIDTRLSHNFKFKINLSKKELVIERKNLHNKFKYINNNITKNSIGE